MKLACAGGARFGSGGRRASRWRTFARRTTVHLVAGVAVLVFGSFMLIHLIGGDPVRASMGLLTPASVVARRRAALHLNDPLLEQFWLYVKDLVHLRFGTSIPSGQPVSITIRSRLPNTLELAGLAMAFVAVFSVVIGTTIGAITSAGRRRGVEAIFAGVTGVAIAIPEFLMATLLAFLFAVTWHLLPVEGKGGVTSFVLPAAALALAPTALLARIIRIETLKVLETDYMRTAQSKRLPRRLFYVRHALPNLLTSALTLGGVIFGGLIGGALIVENVFGWPGIGTAVVEAILERDYPTVQAIVLVVGVMILIVNTAVDAVLALINPRSAIVEN